MESKAGFFSDRGSNGSKNPSDVNPPTVNWIQESVRLAKYTVANLSQGHYSRSHACLEKKTPQCQGGGLHFGRCLSKISLTWHILGDRLIPFELIVGILHVYNPL